MTNCPDCQNPTPSLMMIDARNKPEFYCERCARTWPIGKTVPRKHRVPAYA